MDRQEQHEVAAPNQSIEAVVTDAQQELAVAQQQLLSPEEEAKYQAKARWRSRTHAFAYLGYSWMIGIAFIAAFNLATNPEAVDLRKWLPAETLQAFPPQLAPLLTPKPDSWAWIGAVGLGVLLIYNSYQLGWQWLFQWRPMVQRAGRIHDETAVIDAFTTLYRIYVHTRSVGVHGYMWAALGLMATALFAESASWGAVVALFAVSIGNLACSYLLSNIFKIGEPLVDTLGQIAYRSAHPYDTHHAASNTIEIARQHRRTHYWWFY